MFANQKIKSKSMSGEYRDSCIDALLEAGWRRHVEPHSSLGNRTIYVSPLGVRHVGLVNAIEAARPQGHLN